MKIYMTSAFTGSFVLRVVSCSETSSLGIRLCHQLELIEPVILILMARKLREPGQRLRWFLF
jgi:hypothetical protein